MSYPMPEQDNAGPDARRRFDRDEDGRPCCETFAEQDEVVIEDEGEEADSGWVPPCNEVRRIILETAVVSQWRG
jgi:hypothetical protein